MRILQPAEWSKPRGFSHGVEVDGRFFCCAHCARASGLDKGVQVRDAVGAPPG